ncbi:MAG: hypothetical protein JXR61_07230 [Prolixibacteraceae bacterium]|nr:hypothetical protein [Bacteroidales bacterium]MBN2636045.1 hypothetical protein [Prolixibacteraceae bacterium]
MDIKLYSGHIDNDDRLNIEQENSFRGGFKTVLLPSGFILWRFLSKKMDNPFRAYWIDRKTMMKIMELLHQYGNFSESFKKENIRNSLAMPSNYSKLNWRIKIKLNKEVIAHIGVTGSQKMFEKQKANIFPSFSGNTVEKTIETRMGGCFQYVIPRFQKLPVNNEWARIELFVHL